MAQQITINQLFRLVKNEISKGNGNKKILLSSDDEGNEFHEMFFGFTPVEKVICGEFPPVVFASEPLENYVILG